MAKIVFNIAYFSPIVISRCWAQEETKRETTEINMGEKQEKRGGGACYLAAEGRNFHRYSSPRPFAICHHSFISVFTASSCLMPCRFANNAAPPPPLLFYEFAVKIYDSPLSIDLRAEHAYDDGYNNRLSKNK